MSLLTGKINSIEAEVLSLGDDSKCMVPYLHRNSNL